MPGYFTMVLGIELWSVCMLTQHKATSFRKQPIHTIKVLVLVLLSKDGD